MLIYLAGPINGCSDSECKDWREYVKSQIGEENTLDPMRRDYRGKEMECVDEIVEGDKADIDLSTHILINYDRPSVGTAMEILYAWERKKPIFVVAASDTKLSPWLMYHCEKIFNSFDSALTYMALIEEKIYPSKISVVYPEGSLHLKLAIHAFNHLDYHLEQNAEEARVMAKEFGVTEDELFAALEDLYTEN